ncbi:PP0621 family protein [Niveibacterium terrae]|uniref:PP0621 family protein n=1 Tax=Niveibacterium terrae TaxID=3373598 RepID=UPI003A90A089
MRYLLLFLLGLFAVWTLRRTVEGGLRRRHQGQPAPRALPETMRECAHCGLHVPESEAERDGEHFYCSPAHRRAGPRDRSPR